MTFGSRFAGMGDPLAGGMPYYRYLGNRLTTTVQNLLLGTRFTDMHSGMRAYTGRCLESLPFLAYSEGFSFDAELLVDAVTSGQRVVEVPIPTRYTKESSSISILRSLAYIWQRDHATRPGARPSADAGAGGTSRGGAAGGGPRLRSPRGGGAVTCVVCGTPADAPALPGDRHRRRAAPEEFRCTTSALGVHDDILECPRCGLLSSRPTDDPDEIAAAVRGGRRQRLPGRGAGAAARLFGWVLGRIDGYRDPGATGCWRSARTSGSSCPWPASGDGRRPGSSRRPGPSSTVASGSASTCGAAPSRPSRSSRGSVDAARHAGRPRAPAGSRWTALRRLRPVVSDDGLLALSTVNVEGLHGRVRGGAWPWFIRVAPALLPAAHAPRMLADAGFEAVEWSVVPRAFHASYLLQRASRRPPRRRARRARRLLGDPKIPAGWMGDVTLTILARPADVRAELDHGDHAEPADHARREALRQQAAVQPILVRQSGYRVMNRKRSAPSSCDVTRSSI